MTTSKQALTYAQKIKDGFGYPHAQDYHKAWSSMISVVKDAGETFFGRKSGYKLSKERIEKADQHLSVLIAPVGDKKMTVREVYDQYNATLLAYWSMEQYKHTPSPDRDYLRHLSRFMSSLTFEFREEVLGVKLSKNNDALPFENAAIVNCKALYDELASKLATVSDTAKPAASFGTGGRKLDYYEIFSLRENVDMYALPKFAKKAEYVSSLVSAKRNATILLSDNVIKAWKFNIRDKSQKAIKYAAEEYALQILTKSEFRLDCVVETSTLVKNFDGQDHYAKIAVLVSGEAYEYPNDLSKFDGKLKRSELLSGGSASFFHKTFGFADTIILVPFDLVPLFFKPTYPLGLLYDYSEGSEPLELTVRNHYANWFNIREMGYYMYPSHVNQNITPYYIRRLQNVVTTSVVGKDKATVSTLEKDGKDFFFTADNNAKNELRDKDLARAEGLQQFVPPLHFMDEEHWPYSKEIRGGVGVPVLFTGAAHDLRLYKPTQSLLESVLAFVIRETGYGGVVERSKHKGDTSHRYNAAYLTERNKRLYDYNVSKFDDFNNTEIPQAVQDLQRDKAGNFGYNVYQNEIRTICNGESSSVVCYDARNAFLSIGARVSFSKKQEGLTQPGEGKKNSAKTSDNSTLVSISKIDLANFDLDDDDEFDDEYEDNMDIDDGEDEDDISGISEDEGDDSGSKKRKLGDLDDVTEEDRPFKRLKQTNSSFHKRVQKKKRKKSHKKFFRWGKKKGDKTEKFTKFHYDKHNTIEHADAIVVSTRNVDKYDPNVDRIILKFREYAL